MKRRYYSKEADEQKEHISDIVKKWKEEKRSFNNQTHLIRELLKDKNINISKSTVERYFKEMNFIFHSSSNYGFNDRTTFFDSLISYLDFSNHICFYIRETSIGSFLAEKLNEHYSSFTIGLGDYVHCVALQDLLICFYNESKKKNITKERLAKEIPRILSKTYYDTQ